nr:MAG TPA: hypothetical protein [Caudoviricetes sp.]
MQRYFHLLFIFCSICFFSSLIITLAFVLSICF